jgi:dihydropteroate synthase
MQKNPRYQDIIFEILSALQKSINLALKSGVKKENIIIDPGIGFGKTTEHNLYLIKQGLRIHSTRPTNPPRSFTKICNW